jgi:DNA repair exonuclease SbcCD ATPase subunit
MPHKAAHDQLDELRRRVAEEGQKLRSAQAELEAAKARVEDRSRALTDAYALENARLAHERRNELQRADADVADLEHRVAGAELRAQRARGELDSFIAENAQALLKEREGLARELAAELTSAVAAVVKARRAYDAERQHIDQLLVKIPGVEPRYDGVSTGYPWEAELKALERAFRENPEADVPAPRWAGRSHIRNLNAVNRRLKEQRGKQPVIGT